MNHSEFISESVFYEGFKIHPRAQNWDFSDDATFELTERVFSFAEQNKLRILIHTGESENDFPRKFEPFIAKYSKCIIQLAHIKKIDEAIYMLNNYSNVVFDTAFSNQENILKIQNKGFANRLVYGSDFPIKDHTNLKGEVIIPNGVKEIHRNAFLNCQNIKKIFVPPGSLVKID